MKSAKYRVLLVFLSLLFVFPFICPAQDEIEKISLDPNKKITKGEHRIPSPKTQKDVLTARNSEDSQTASQPISVFMADKSFGEETNIQIAAGNGEMSQTVSAASKLNAVARRESLKARIAAKPLTEIYRVGTGDILDIRLLNAPAAKDSTLYTVLENGLIDYPLAGETVSVAGLTTEEIADLLIEKIKLYDAPEIAVGVRDYASHKIAVAGAVEKPGAKTIRREAIPLFTVLAEAVQLPSAKRAAIIRRNKETFHVNLRDLNGDVLIYDGDLIRILSDEEVKETKQQFYFIAGLIASPGQKEFHSGLTVMQAILASGGTSVKSAHKAVIMRENEKGFLLATEVDLKLLRTGKMQDIRLENGDRIEIK